MFSNCFPAKSGVPFNQHVIILKFIQFNGSEIVSVLKLLFVINEFEQFGMVFPFYELLVLALFSLNLLVF